MSCLPMHMIIQLKVSLASLVAKKSKLGVRRVVLEAER